MTDIKTYPSMNKEIKYILGQSESHTDQYAVARIVELEKTLEFYAKVKSHRKPIVENDHARYLGQSPIELDRGEKARESLKDTSQ